MSPNSPTGKEVLNNSVPPTGPASDVLPTELEVDEIRPVRPTSPGGAHSGTTESIVGGVGGLGEDFGLPLLSAPEYSGVVDVVDSDSDVDMSAGTGGDGVEVDMAVNPVELSNFKAIDAVIDIALIDEPEDPTREVKPEHEAGIHSLLVRNGYMPSSGRLSIAFREEDKDADLSDLVKDGVVQVRTLLVDGRHRKLGLGKLREKTPDIWDEVCKKLPVTLWLPRNAAEGRSIPMHEIIELGRRLNDLSGSSLGTSFYDNVVQVLSIIRNFAKRTGTSLANLSVRSMALRLEEMKALGGLKQRSLQRYILIAKRISSSELVRDRIRHGCQKFNLTMVHLSDATVMALSDERLCVVVDFMCEWARVNGTAFSRVKPNFVVVAEEALLAVEGFATKHSCSLSVALQMELTLSRKKTTVYHYLVSRMGNVKAHTSPSSLISSLQKQLSKLAPPLSHPPVEGNDPNVGLDTGEEADVGAGTVGAAHGDGGPTVTGEDGDGGGEVGGADGDNVGEGGAPDNVGGGEVSGAEDRGGADETAEDAGKEGGRRSKRTKNKAPGSYAETSPTKGLGTRKRNREEAEPADRHRAFIRRRVIRDLKVLPLAEVMTIARELGIEARPRSPTPAVAEPKFQDAVQSFNDTLPDDLPLGCSEFPRYTGSDTMPKWSYLFVQPPSAWKGKEKLITHVLPIMLCLHLSHRHRAGLFLTVADFIENHHMVFWHATANFLRKNPDAMMTDRIDPPAVAPFRIELYRGGVDRTIFAPVYLGEQAVLLRERGYCILEGFLNDANLPSKGPRGIKVTPWGSLEELAKDMEESFPKTDKAFAESKLWTWISNHSEEEDRKDGVRRIGRMYSTNEGVTTALEQDKNRLWAAEMRARLDARIAQSLAALKIWDNVGIDKGRYFMMRTGGRWLLTSKGCKRQALHTDFAVDGPSDMPLGYYVICSSQEAFLWVCEFSHKILGVAEQEDVPRLSKGMQVVKVRIPPNSIFIGRGDSFHAGASHEDLRCEGISLRYHVYIRKVGHEIPDGIHLLPTFQPRFVDLEEDWELEDEAQGEQAGRAAGSGKEESVGGSPAPSEEDAEEDERVRLRSTSSAESSVPKNTPSGRKKTGGKEVMSPRGRVQRRNQDTSRATPDHISETPEPTPEQKEDIGED